jgi:hypothetical protein
MRMFTFDAGLSSNVALAHPVCFFLQAMTKTRGWHYWVVTWCYIRAPRSRWLPSRQGRLLLLVEVYEFHSVCIDVLYLVHLCNVSL